MVDEISADGGPQIDDAEEGAASAFSHKALVGVKWKVTQG